MDWPPPCWESISSDVRRSWQTLAGRGPGKLGDLGAKDRTAAPSQPPLPARADGTLEEEDLEDIDGGADERLDPGKAAGFSNLLQFWEALPASMATKPQKAAHEGGPDLQ